MDSGCRVRFFLADALMEPPHRGFANNGVGRVIDSILRERPLMMLGDHALGWPLGP